MTKNHLMTESSPYLQQHANNPVDWYPWGEEAIQKAQQENKPILLSIGYTACHWCHVMAHESFEDIDTANLMNKYFINIKVDREERPDLDKIYQTAHYLLTQQSGGWPLTVFLTPDLTPFFSGTYFPKAPRYHLPAFKQVLESIAQVYQQQKSNIEQQNKALLAMLKQTRQVSKNVNITAAPLQVCLQSLTKMFDTVHGGFNGAPKFPQAPKLLWLLFNEPSMTLTTLDHMLEGGIYDQLGGGFYRYTVDDNWQIPHFEKMLYDNAQLIYLLCIAYQITKNHLYQKHLTETVNWTFELQDQTGGFYSSIDADSEGEEGKYYLWDQSEFDTVLTKQEQRIAKIYFGLDKKPNMDGKWHLIIASTMDDIASKMQVRKDEVEKLLVQAKQSLLQARKKRTSPIIDTKILVAWNSLQIKSLFYAGDILKQSSLIDVAEKTLDLIHQNGWQNGQLYSQIVNNKVKNNAFLDDYIFLIDALMTSLQVKWVSKRFNFAIELMEYVITHFIHPQGGFYFTSDKHEEVLYRPQIWMDEAIPSGNGIALQCLLLLGHLLGNEKYLGLAEKLLQVAWSQIANYPSEHCSLIAGLKNFLQPPKIIVIRGEGEELELWRGHCQDYRRYVFAISSQETELPEALALRTPKQKICAYICEGNVCSAVITNIDELEEKLQA